MGHDRGTGFATAGRDSSAMGGDDNDGSAMGDDGTAPPVIISGGSGMGDDDDDDGIDLDADDDGGDDLTFEAIELVKRTGKASASMLQRHLKVGYARAARILDILEEKGVVGPVDGAKARKVYVE